MENIMNNEKLLNDIKNSIKISKDFRFNDTSILVKDLEEILKLIHCLKSENERLTSLYDGKSAYMTSSIGDLPLTVEGLRKAVDEISRLLIVQGELQDLNAKCYNEAKDLRRENGELQKQVDELKFDKDLLQKLLVKREQQSVKDTAKEILQKMDCLNNAQDLGLAILDFSHWIEERYGVEVE